MVWVHLVLSYTKNYTVSSQLHKKECEEEENAY